MFPTSVSGSIELDCRDPQHTQLVLAQIDRALALAKASRIERHGHTIDFRGRIWDPVSGWAVLGYVGSGRIEVVLGAPTRVDYTFSTAEFLVTVSGMLVAMGALVTAQDGLSGATLAFVLGGWLLLFGANYLIVAQRLRGFVRRASAVSPTAVRCPSCGAIYDPLDYREDVEAVCESCRLPLPLS